MKTLLLLVLVMVGLPILTVYIFHNWVFRPRRIIQSILTALKNGPKTPAQLALATRLDTKNLESFLEALEKQWRYIRREHHPAFDPENPGAPDLIYLTESGSLEIEKPNF